MATASSRAPRTSQKSTSAQRHVDLDLDTLVVEGSDLPPFTVKIAGHIFTLADPGSLDWKLAVVIANSQDPRLLFDNVLSDEERTLFYEQSITMRQMTELSRQYREHYNFDETFAGN